MSKIIMNEKQIIKLAMIESGESLKSLSDKVGVNYKAIANQLRRQDSTLTLSSFYTLLNAMGFEITIKPKSEKHDSDEYVLRERTESSAEWEKITAIELAEAKFKKIGQDEIARIKVEEGGA